MTSSAFASAWRLNRRQFLALSSALLPVGQPARTLNVVVLAGDSTGVRSSRVRPRQGPPEGGHYVPSMVERGFAVGSMEARRTTGLLNADWRETVVRGTPAAAVLRGVDAVIALGTIQRAVSDRLALLSAVELPTGAPINAFSVRASPRAKQRALQAWRTRKKGTVDAVAAVEWHESLDRYGAEQLNERFLASASARPDAAVWAGWMAVKVVTEALMKQAGPLTGEALLALTFDGHKGVPLRFEADTRHLRQPLCVVSASGSLLGTIDPDDRET